MKKMKVEIWSDITCTFCYVAKRHFESALDQFSHRDRIEVIWKSMELAPNLKTDAKKQFPQFLAELKNISLQQSVVMIDEVVNALQGPGTEFNLHHAIPANTFNAHRLLHFAKQFNAQQKTGATLFAAYFSRGLNIDDVSVLCDLGKESGLDPAAVRSMLENDAFADSVRQDIREAQQAGITSVPHFRFNSSFSLSGSQDSRMYLDTLEKTFAEWQSLSVETQADSAMGEACKIGETCL